VNTAVAALMDKNQHSSGPVMRSRDAQTYAPRYACSERRVLSSRSINAAKTEAYAVRVQVSI